MTIQVRGAVFLTAVIASALLVGCRDRSINRDDLIGRFEYHSGNKPQGSICFVLGSDGGYVVGDASAPLSQISMSGTPPRGTWKLSFEGTGQGLIIGKSRLPVQRAGSSIRVTVNDDLGMYCDLQARR
jgi:hypothetical protein